MKWEKVKLGEILFPREERFNPKDKSIKSLRRIDKIDFAGNIYLSDSPSKTDMILIKSGDLVISGINVYKGALAVYEGEVDIVATIHYSSYQFDGKRIDIDFLKLLLKSSAFLNAIKEQVPGGIKTEIKPKHLLPLQIGIPSLEDQQTIVRKYLQFEILYKNLNSEVDVQIKLISKLRVAVLRDAIKGRLVHQDPKDEPASELLKRIKVERKELINKGKIGKEKPLPDIKQEEIPFEIPESWIWCRFGDLADVVRGGSPRPAGDKRFYDGKIPFLKVGDLTSDGEIFLNTYTHSIKEAGLRKTRFVDANTLMLTNSGATLGIPKICSFPTTFNDGIAAFLNIPEEINKVYLYYYLKYMTKWFLNTASRGQGQPNLNTDIIKLSIVPLPSFNEQNRIVEKLTLLMESIENLNKNTSQNISKTKLLFHSLLNDSLKYENME